MNFGNPTSKEESFKIIGRAIEAGINLFDCADVYAEGESERILGEALDPGWKEKRDIRHQSKFTCLPAQDQMTGGIQDTIFLKAVRRV